MSDLGLGIEEPRGGQTRPRRLGGCLAVIVALAIIVGLGALVYVKGVDAIKGWVDSTSTADYHGTGHGSVVIQVKAGETASDIGATLEKADVVKSARAFADAAAGKEAKLQVGYYRMRRQMSGEAAVQLMLSPSSRITTGVTVPEGLRANEILALIVAHSKFTSAQMNQAYADTKALGLPSYAKGDPEGYLYPATYPLTPGSTPASLLSAMTARFAQEADTVKLTQGAAALHMSPTDVVIVASLVQAEASRAQDMPKVARVIYNRLKDNMPLQLDSTLHYAVNSRGVVEADQQLRELKTPYNSYTHTGLPPTPIDSPGELALQAALHPTAGPWRYFVTVNLTTGKTLFATTFQEHEHNRSILLQYCASHPSC